MESMEYPVNEQLTQMLSRRGWTVSEAGTSLRAHKHDWPAQLRVVIDPGGGSVAATLGITIDFRSMPLAGERFRDIFNSDREEIMRGMGSFFVRQMRGDHGWTDGVTDRVFLHGVEGGISRMADVVLFDRCPAEHGVAMLNRFSLESSRLLETGGEIASLLQRTYNRTVLLNDAPLGTLPGLVIGHGTAAATVVAEPSYPWRR